MKAEKEPALLQKSTNIKSTVHVEIDDLLKNWGY
jgi:hypothetical protein